MLQFDKRLQQFKLPIMFPTGSLYSVIVFLTDTRFLRPFRIKATIKVEVLSQHLYSSKSKKKKKKVQALES